MIQNARAYAIGKRLGTEHWRELFLCLFLSGIAVNCLAQSGQATEDLLADMDLSTLMESQSAQALELKAKLHSRVRMSLDNPSELYSLRQRLWLDAYLGRGDIRGFVSAYAEVDSKQQQQFYARVHEAYLTLDGEQLDWHIGKKMLRWGTGDGVNPMDMINPQDLRDPFASGRSDSRLPVNLVSAVWTDSAWTLETVYLPKAHTNEMSDYSLPTWLTTMSDGTEQVTARRQIATLGHEYGLRLSSVIQGVDWSLMHFRGVRNAPLQLTNHAANTTKVLYSPELNAWGISFATSVMGGTWRGEVAQKSLDIAEIAGSGLAGLRSYHAVLGGDYTFFTSFYVNAQVFYEAMDNAQVVLSVPERAYGLTYSISQKFLADALTLGARGMHYSSLGDGVAELFAEYKHGDRLILTPGVFLFYGSGEGQLGRFGNRDFIYFNLTYHF